MPEFPTDPQLTPLEDSLRVLQPASSLSRETVLFEAGRRAAARGHLWRWTTALASSVAAVLGWLLIQRPETPAIQPGEPRVVIVEKVVVKLVPIPPKPPAQDATTSPAVDPTPGDYLRKRREVVRWGVDLLPMAPPQNAGGDALTPAALPRLVPSESSQEKDI